MIPIHLSISGFLSYRDEAEVDFSAFELACISGANGAGKSSLLDAITWALFGQARKRDDALINAQSPSAEVTLTFAYEGNIYRVQRIKPRDKTTLLEFFIQQSDNPTDSTAGDKRWKPLTERSLRETEERIRQILRLDYETFTNASFFLQGKADQFTQQRPGDRKRILSSILGLEIWEVYREKAALHRRQVEAEVSRLDGRLKEIEGELAEEQARKERLEQLQADLRRQEQQRQLQEAALAGMRQMAATLVEQQKLVEALERQHEQACQRLEGLEKRLAERMQERQSYQEVLGRAARVEKHYSELLEARKALQAFEAIASRFRERDKRREELRLEIRDARARLEQELSTLQEQSESTEAVTNELEALQPQVKSLREDLAMMEDQLIFRKELETKNQAGEVLLANAKTENQQLRQEMEELKDRIDSLSLAGGANCPLCGQPLSPLERENLINSFRSRGNELGDRFRANQNKMRELEAQREDYEKKISELAELDTIQQQQTIRLTQLTSRQEMLQTQISGWKSGGMRRIEEIVKALKKGTFAAEAQKSLAIIDAELKETGYDASAHDSARQVETERRVYEADFLLLEKARAAAEPLDREISELQASVRSQSEERAQQEAELRSASAALEEALKQAPDLQAAERMLLDLQEAENHLRMEVGSARQEVLVLEGQKKRHRLLQTERKDSVRQAKQYSQLERAFGKDGVPALLIEQALPEIEAKANEVLDRLSAGSMTVRFVTQAVYKDKNREDLKETLDIQISDTSGTRDYEMFSGGEAFRVNFAIRLALSKVLAQRAGARLQTLVIDEGFGSQDTQGRQRLVEAINLVRSDFAKILVITHIDELKDAFPTRIEVEKTERGSILQVVG